MADSDRDSEADVSGDDGLVLALATGHSVRAAAKLAGVSESTVYRRFKDTDFLARVQEVRAEMMSRASGRLASGAVKAAAALKRLLKSENETIVLGSARALLDLNNKLRDSIIFDERLRALESRAKG